jgi:hypothetical protein
LMKERWERKREVSRDGAAFLKKVGQVGSASNTSLPFYRFHPFPASLIDYSEITSIPFYSISIILCSVLTLSLVFLCSHAHYRTPCRLRGSVSAGFGPQKPPLGAVAAPHGATNPASRVLALSPALLWPPAHAGSIDRRIFEPQSR